MEWKVEEANSAEEKALQFAAAALIHCGDHDIARTYVDQLLRVNSSSVPGLVLNGWLGLYTNNTKAAARAFKAALGHVSEFYI